MREDEEDIPKRIFIFGHTGVGKTTLFASIWAYMEKKHNVFRNPVTNREGVLLIREWIKSFKNKEFPPATPNIFQPIHMGYMKKNKIEGITLYEVAGEEVVKINPIHEDSEKKDPKLLEWLSVSDAIIVVAPSIKDSYQEENGFEHNMSDIGEDIQDFYNTLISYGFDLPICFVLSKWDKRDKKFKKPEELAKEHYKGFFQKIRNDRRSKLIGFSVGKVNSSNDVIEELDENYGTKQIFNWIQNLKQY